MGPIFFFQWSPYPHDKDEVCMLMWLIDFDVYALTLYSPHIHIYIYTGDATVWSHCLIMMLSVTY